MKHSVNGGFCVAAWRLARSISPMVTLISSYVTGPTACGAPNTLPVCEMRA
ncbi:MAG: hypothetical protein ACJ8AI_20665 [Rhodopila sp.]